MDLATKDNNPHQASASPQGEGNKKTKITSPFFAATRFLDEVASESLQPHTAPIIMPIAKTYCHMRSKAFHRLKQFEKFKQDNELIPKSAQISPFKLHVSKEGESTPEFAAIKQKVDEATSEYQLKLKTNILELTKLEAKILQEEANKKLASGLRTLCQTLLISKNETGAKADMIASTIMHRYYGKLLRDCPDINKDKFISIYKYENNLSTIPNPEYGHSNISEETNLTEWARQAQLNLAAIHQTTHTANMETGVQNRTQSQLTPAKSAIARATVQHHGSYQYKEIMELIAKLFLKPWEIYKTQEQHNTTIVELKKLQSNNKRATTEDTAEQLEKEPSADPALLKQLINESTAKETKTLKAEVQKLTKTVNYLEQKNLIKRGQGKGASNKKKNQTTTQVKTKAAQKKKAAPVKTKKGKFKDIAGEKGKGLKENKGKWKKTNGTKKKNWKNPPSKTGSDKR